MIATCLYSWSTKAGREKCCSSQYAVLAGVVGKETMQYLAIPQLEHRSHCRSLLWDAAKVRPNYWLPLLPTHNTYRQTSNLSNALTVGGLEVIHQGAPAAEPAARAPLLRHSMASVVLHMSHDPPLCLLTWVNSTYLKNWKTLPGHDFPCLFLATLQLVSRPLCQHCIWWCSLASQEA